MNLLEAIPRGKENRLSRKELMRRAEIHEIENFRQELKELRKKYIIEFDDGYYIPNTSEEYDEIILKFENNMKKIKNNIRLAKTIKLEREGMM